MVFDSGAKSRFDRSHQTALLLGGTGQCGLGLGSGNPRRRSNDWLHFIVGWNPDVIEIEQRGSIRQGFVRTLRLRFIGLDRLGLSGLVSTFM